MSRGLPAFFRQFWLHFRKNLRKNLEGRKESFSFQKEHVCKDITLEENDITFLAT
jgi:hypothetical protein